MAQHAGGVEEDSDDDDGLLNNQYTFHPVLLVDKREGSSEHVKGKVRERDILSTIASLICFLSQLTHNIAASFSLSAP